MGNGKDFATSDNRRSLTFPMRLDFALVRKKFSFSRSRAEEYIRSGSVSVNGVAETRASRMIRETDEVVVGDINPYVSRAALKLKSAQNKFRIPFAGKVVLDVGSSTGGFTQFALKAGAKKVIAVDVGTNQMHPSLLGEKRLELHEKTDIRDFTCKDSIDVVVMDVSFISLRYVIPHVLTLAGKNTVIIAMCKPQFEAGKEHVNKGVIKNENIRRKILLDFETWLKTVSVVLDKVDSDTPGEKGNVERFFLLKKSR
jgi:23S rRNA (cytidine1920-2'-O)/16S rRNA (cytidine1409-2'-O)-methyltransferase